MKTILPRLGAAFALYFLFTAFIDLSNLFDYQNQTIPPYILKDNTPLNNEITNQGATLGRVLFYDKNLSANNTIACGSCHLPQFAFGALGTVSIGAQSGQTRRHSMRLAYSRFSDEEKFFWDERASSLEDQTTHPIKDPIEMQFSGIGGQPDFDSLLRKLEQISFYPTLFTLTFGDPSITEQRIQFALAQFIRSIYSFDSKFDAGLAASGGNLNANFSNYTAEENEGKTLFLAPPPMGGAGCAGCHRPPEFDIDPNSLNNGVIAEASNPTSIDLTNTRAPSLRDVFNAAGVLNGPLMHNGAFTSIEMVIDHYNLVPQNPLNTNLDPRLSGPGGNLMLNQTQKEALAAFIKTLSSNDIYTNERWSDPFNLDGSLDLITTVAKHETNTFTVFPNPTMQVLYVKEGYGNYSGNIFDMQGRCVLQFTSSWFGAIEVSSLTSGKYLLHIKRQDGTTIGTSTFIKQ
jgi:cytochrome c peroxidase